MEKKHIGLSHGKRPLMFFFEGRNGEESVGLPQHQRLLCGGSVLFKPSLSGLIMASQPAPTWRIIWLVSPLFRVIPLINGLNGLELVVINHLLTGMILQAPPNVLPTPEIQPYLTLINLRGLR